VDGAGHELLARPALALEVDRQVGRGHALDQLAHAPDGHGLPEQARGARALGPDLRRPGAGPGALDAPQLRLELVDVEGLGQELDRAQRQGREGALHGVRAAGQDHGRPAVGRHLEQEVDARPAGQEDVEQQDIEGLRRELPAGLFPRGGGGRGEALLLHQVRHPVESRLIVVDDEGVEGGVGHGWTIVDDPGG
jgi:hypothetical protein